MKRCLLVYPRPRNGYATTDTPYPFPMVGLPIIASLLSPYYEVQIINEFLTPVDFSAEVDLVGITALTAVAPRAYEVADRFRQRRVPVIIGGVHATFMPEEAKVHADAVVIGEAEPVIDELITDLRAGRLKPFYRADALCDLSSLPPQRRDLLGKGYSPIFKVIETTRGCPNRCEFCAVPAIAGRKYRTRPIAQIAHELSTIVKKKGEYIFIVDDNVMALREHALALFEVLQGFGVKWMGFGTIEVARDRELLRRAAQSGCISLFIGLESLSKENLEGPKRRFRDERELAGLIKRIHDYGIGIQGSFIFGFDHDDPGVFERTVEFIHRNRIELPTLSILTPFPGTPLWVRLERQGRIFDRDWTHYDMSHVVFFPKGMSPEQLQEGYLWAQRYCCAPRSILQRVLLGRGGHRGYFLLSNFVLRRAQMRVIKSITR